MANARLEAFKREVQARIKEKTGKRISRPLAWKIFKTLMSAVLEDAAYNPNEPLSIPRIGRFEIIEHKPRGFILEKSQGKYYMFKWKLPPSTKKTMCKIIGNVIKGE